MLRRITSVLAVAGLVAAVAGGSALATTRRGADTTAHNAYRVTNLVSDQPGHAAVTDANLVNAWGIAASPTSPWWVADNGTNKSTLYDAAGAIQSLVVNVPVAPTGAVFNGTQDFDVTDGTASAPSLFLFATENGTILGWNPAVPLPAPSTNAFVVATGSQGAIYKGLAIASTASGNFLYATDFHNGHVDVFDGQLQPVNTPGAFVDPNLPHHFAPFGIQNLGGTIFVTYAKQDADAEDEIDGEHLGIVDTFDPTGMFLGRVATRGPLNAPWGLALAPSDFGKVSGDLLVGNFGDGLIHAFQRMPDGSYARHGVLRKPSGHVVQIDGLWGISFGNGGGAGPTTTLYFAAGPDGENHGLFGKIEAK